MSTVDRAGSVIGTNFALGSYKKFQPGFRDEKKKQISWGGVLARNSRNKANMVKHKNYNFRAHHSIGNSSLQLNGMLTMWKIQQAMQDDAIRTVRIHTAFIPVTGMTCLCGKIFSPLTVIPVGKT